MSSFKMLRAMLVMCNLRTSLLYDMIVLFLIIHQMIKFEITDQSGTNSPFHGSYQKPTTKRNLCMYLVIDKLYVRAISL